MKRRMDKERLLMRSMVQGTAVGIKLKQNNAFIVSAVVNFGPGNDHEKWVEIKPFTLYGKTVDDPVISLNDIEEVVAYGVRYDDPVYRRLREIKARILGIK